LQIISENSKYVNFFLQVSDKGIEIENQQLREAARCILKLIPPAECTVKKIQVFHCLFIYTVFRIRRIYDISFKIFHFYCFRIFLLVNQNLLMKI